MKNHRYKLERRVDFVASDLTPPSPLNPFQRILPGSYALEESCKFCGLRRHTLYRSDRSGLPPSRLYFSPSPLKQVKHPGRCFPKLTLARK
jgi:hypothetical protein